MSMHKIPLTAAEETGLRAHGLQRNIGKPSQLADVFRQGVAWGMISQREQMIADGWRQTRYVAPVTDCEACLTPDACVIRGQCGHYLRERA